MRYYIDIDLNVKNTIEILTKKMKFEKKKEHILLTNDGLYKYIKNDLYCFKINNNNNESIINNYISNINIIKTDNLWKKIFLSNQLPFEHFKMSITTYTFFPYDKKEFKFIIELYENDKIDYYFETNENDEKSFFLKESISSFLKENMNLVKR